MSLSPYLFSLPGLNLDANSEKLVKNWEYWIKTVWGLSVFIEFVTVLFQLCISVAVRHGPNLSALHLKTKSQPLDGQGNSPEVDLHLLEEVVDSFKDPIKAMFFPFPEKCTIRQIFAYNSRGFERPLGHFGTPRESPDLYSPG